MSNRSLTGTRRRPRLPGDARAGAPSDWLRVSWLVETSRRVYTRWGTETLRDLLAGPGAVVWQPGRTLKGALLTDGRHGAVATARLLAVHDNADLVQFGAEVLPLVERRLARQGVCWVSFSSPEAWLRELLAAHGYALKDRVITYARRGLDLEAQGNPDVAVEGALPEDVPGMLAVDREAFEPFWRLDAETLRRALDEDAYVLVARWGAVVGYLTADVWEERAHVVRLAVAPAFQGRGVGTRLMAELFRRMGGGGAGASTSRRSSFDLREVGGGALVREVTLNTQETNLRSRLLYEGLGFRATGGVEEVWAREVAPPTSAD